MGNAWKTSGNFTHPKGDEPVFPEREINQLPSLFSSFVQKSLEMFYLITFHRFHAARSRFGTKIDEVLERFQRMTGDLVFKTVHSGQPPLVERRVPALVSGLFFDQGQVGFADAGRGGLFEMPQLALLFQALDIVVEHVVLRDDRVDDKIDNDGPFPLLRRVEVLEAGMVLRPKRREGRFIQRQNLIRYLFEHLFDHCLILST